MTRSQVREIAMHLTFALGVSGRPAAELVDELLDKGFYATLKEEDELYADYPSNSQAAYLRRLASGVDEHLAELDSYIEKYAKNWKVGRIDRVAVAVMRVAMYEVLYMPDVPNAAAVNEAVEIAKKYLERETVSFLNGILGSFIRGECSE